MNTIGNASTQEVGHADRGQRPQHVHLGRGARPRRQALPQDRSAGLGAGGARGGAVRGAQSGDRRLPGRRGDAASQGRDAARPGRLGRRDALDQPVRRRAGASRSSAIATSGASAARPGRCGSRAPARCRAPARSRRTCHPRHEPAAARPDPGGRCAGRHAGSGAAWLRRVRRGLGGAGPARPRQRARRRARPRPRRAAARRQPLGAGVRLHPGVGVLRQPAPRPDRRSGDDRRDAQLGHRRRARAAQRGLLAGSGRHRRPRPRRRAVPARSSTATSTR